MRFSELQQQIIYIKIYNINQRQKITRQTVQKDFYVPQVVHQLQQNT